MISDLIQNKKQRAFAFCFFAWVGCDATRSFSGETSPSPTHLWRSHNIISTKCVHHCEATSLARSACLICRRRHKGDIYVCYANEKSKNHAFAWFFDLLWFILTKFYPSILVSVSVSITFSVSASATASVSVTPSISSSISSSECATLVKLTIC